MARLNVQFARQQYRYDISSTKHLNISFDTAVDENGLMSLKGFFPPYLKHTEPWVDSIGLWWRSGVIKAGNETGG